jgi:hypothetical protein
MVPPRIGPPDCRTRLLGVLGDLKNLVKRPLKTVTCAAKFIVDSSLSALIPLVTGKYGWVHERPPKGANYGE